jgi:Xaa-Pro aminopeptidase
LFERSQTARETLYFGPNLGALPVAQQRRFGIESIKPLDSLLPTLSQLTGRQNTPFGVRSGYPDRLDLERLEIGLAQASDDVHPFGNDHALNRDVVLKLRRRYPQVEIRNVVPMIDTLRNLKTPSEIAVLRRNGKLSAEAVRDAIARAKAGMFEYEIEADAARDFLRAGAQGVAYPAIVASGPNVNVVHYFRNRRQIAKNDLVVFDFAADLDHLTMDITRTFNVGGAFSPEQAKWYGVDLEAQLAIIELLKPGHTYEEAADAGRSVYDRYGIVDQWDGFPGHFVGEATHDVALPARADSSPGKYWGPSGPVMPGQVVTVEPIIAFPNKDLHLRIEDTILITDDGNEVLTSAVPKTLVDIQSLVGRDSKTRTQ